MKVQELIKEGDTLRKKGEYKEALKFYEKAVKKDSKCAKAWYKKGNALFDLRKNKDAQKAYEKAVEFYSEVIKKEPDNIEALNNMGAALLKLKKHKVALGAAEKVIKKEPENARAWYIKGSALHNSRRYEEALEAFEEVFRLDSEYTSALVDALVKKGNRLSKSKKYMDALKWYEKAIDINPKYTEAWRKRGNALYRLKEYEKAKKSFRKADILNSRTNDSWVDALAKKGDDLRSNEEYIGALKAFEESIEIDPKQATLWNKKAYVLFKLGRYEDSLESYSKATELEKRNFYSWYKKGYILLKLARYEDAWKAFDKAIRIKPEMSFLWNNKGFALLNLKQYEKALKAFDKAIELDRSNSYFWSNRGDALLNLGRYREAFAAFEEAIMIKPQYTSPYVGLGRLFFENGCLEDASKQVEKALKQNRNHAPALLLEGKIKIEKKEYDSAIEFFEKASYSDLGNPLPLIWTAYVRYLKAESSVNREDKAYQEEIFALIRELERANALSEKNAGKELRACILYFLGYFYYKSEDIFAAKEKLEECIQLKTKSLVEKRARELLKNLWNNTIKPAWWDWWLYSPFCRESKRAIFAAISSSTFSLLLHTLFPKFLSFIEAEWPAYVIVTGFLIFTLLSPNIESIRAKEIDIVLHSPPFSEPFLSPSTMEEKIGSLPVN